MLFQLRRVLREAAGGEGTVWIHRLAGGPIKLISVPFRSTNYPRYGRRALRYTCYVGCSAAQVATRRGVLVSSQPGYLSRYVCSHLDQLAWQRGLGALRPVWLGAAELVSPAGVGASVQLGGGAAGRVPQLMWGPCAWVRVGHRAVWVRHRAIDASSIEICGDTLHPAIWWAWRAHCGVHHVPRVGGPDRTKMQNRVPERGVCHWYYGRR